MTKSQNGWEAKPDTTTFTRGTARCRGGDFKFWAANSDVAVVFTEFIQRYDVEVEPVVGSVLDDWSYANRLVRGSETVVSNHGSATAIDINALRYPLGTRHMSTDKLNRLRAIQQSITDDRGEPVLRLGADYAGRVDQMHTEINASPTRVKQAANKIRARLQEEADMSDADVRAIKAAIPTTAQIVAALKPVIAAEVAAQLAKWQNQPVDLGPFAGSTLPDAEGKPSTRHKAGDLLEYSAAHAAQANRNTQAILARLPEPADVPEPDHT